MFLYCDKLTKGDGGTSYTSAHYGEGGRLTLKES